MFRVGGSSETPTTTNKKEDETPRFGWEKGERNGRGGGRSDVKGEGVMGRKERNMLDVAIGEKQTLN